MKSKQSATMRLVSIIQELFIVRPRDLLEYGVHPEVLQRAPSVA